MENKFEASKNRNDIANHSRQSHFQGNHLEIHKFIIDCDLLRSIAGADRFLFTLEIAGTSKVSKQTQIKRLSQLTLVNFLVVSC